MKINLGEVRKLLVAAVGVIAFYLSHGLLHGTAATVATYIIGIATVVGVWAVPNDPAAASTDVKTVTPTK